MVGRGGWEGGWRGEAAGDRANQQHEQKVFLEHGLPIIRFLWCLDSKRLCYTFQNPLGSEITAIPSRTTHALILLIFLISAGLRLGLVSFNRESNDDHFTVIQLILKTDRLPEKADCWECYQPKLFHYTAAKFLQLTGLENANPGTMILAVELLNYTAGLITLLVIGLFLYRLPGKNGLLKVLAFGLVAFNPDLIGINSQATNDTFAILFSTLALYCTYAFLQKKKPVTFLLILLFTILGICSKTNVWITAIAIFLALLVKAWMEKPDRVQILRMAVNFRAGHPGSFDLQPAQSIHLELS